jgi:Prp8 binding protein
VAAGGGDRSVTVWDVQEGKIAYKLPGHKGTVTGVDFHPRSVVLFLSFTAMLTSREPIILTGSKDTNLLLGELDAQDYS